VPFINKGKFTYFLGRDFLNRDKKYKYKNPSKNDFGVGRSEILFNEDALMKYDKVYLSEGVFCAKTIGEQGIATLGWSMSPIQKNKIIKSHSKELIVAADVGFYKKAVQAMIPFLPFKNIKVVNFENESLAAVGGDIALVSKNISL